MEHTLKGSEYIYKYPEARAKDLMDAFKNPDIKAIFSCIGGDDSIRILPYIDFEIIRKNPKIFIGYSDSTIIHLICYKAGLTSFYGPSVLAELAENNKMFDYTREYLNKILFSNDSIGLIPATEKWPDESAFDDAILFFETSEDTPEPTNLLYWLRNYAALGILQKSKAIIFGNPYQEKYYSDYREVIKTIVIENNLYNTPIVYNMTFGHNQPMCVLPYGVLAEVNCEEKTFSILESGVL